MDSGRGAGAGQPGGGLAQGRRAGVSVHDHHGVGPGVAAGRLGHGGPVGARPAWSQRPLLHPAHQLRRAGARLFTVVREEQAAVLAVHGAQVGQPAEPGPLAPALLQAPGPVRADQHDLQVEGGVQRGELCHSRAGEPGQPGPRTREPERSGLPQSDGDGHGGKVGPIRGSQPHDQGLGVCGVALPQAGPGAERGEEHGRGVRPGAGRGGGGVTGEGGGVRGGRGIRSGRRWGASRRPVRLLSPAAGEPPGPRTYAAASGGVFVGERGVGRSCLPERLVRVGAVAGRAVVVGMVGALPGGVEAVDGAVLAGAGAGVGTGRGLHGRTRGAARRVRAGHPQMTLAVRRRHQRGRPVAGCEPERGLAEPQQGARNQPDRAVADVRAVQRGAVGGAQVGDGDPAVLGDRHRAVQP